MPKRPQPQQRNSFSSNIRWFALWWATSHSNLGCLRRWPRHHRCPRPLFRSAAKGPAPSRDTEDSSSTDSVAFRWTTSKGLAMSRRRRWCLLPPLSIGFFWCRPWWPLVICPVHGRGQQFETCPDGGTFGLPGGRELGPGPALGSASTGSSSSASSSSSLSQSSSRSSLLVSRWRSRMQRWLSPLKRTPLSHWSMLGGMGGSGARLWPARVPLCSMAAKPAPNDLKARAWRVVLMTESLAKARAPAKSQWPLNSRPSASQAEQPKTRRRPLVQVPPCTWHRQGEACNYYLPQHKKTLDWQIAMVQVRVSAKTSWRKSTMGILFMGT